jgi:hypothetical protein
LTAGFLLFSIYVIDAIRDAAFPAPDARSMACNLLLLGEPAIIYPGQSNREEGMIYKILADLSVLIHFFWILFLVFGLIFALRRSKIAWVHLGGLLLSLLLNLLGWYCPLTYLENYLRGPIPDGGTYSGPFIVHYLELIIYPDLPERTIRTGEILFVCLNLVVYGVLLRSYLLRSHQ